MEKSSVEKSSVKKVPWKKVIEEMRGNKYWSKMQLKMATKLKTITRNTTGQVRSGRHFRRMGPPPRTFCLALLGRVDSAQTQALTGRCFGPVQHVLYEQGPLQVLFANKPCQLCQALRGFRPFQHVQQRQRPCNLTVSFKRNWRKVYATKVGNTPQLNNSCQKCAIECWELASIHQNGAVGSPN